MAHIAQQSQHITSQWYSCVCLPAGGGAVASTNGGANLQFFDSQFGNNSAVVSGGALSVSCTHSAAA